MSASFSIQTTFQVGSKCKINSNRKIIHNRKTKDISLTAKNKYIDKYSLCIKLFDTIKCVATKFILLTIMNSHNNYEKYNCIKNYVINNRYFTKKQKTELLFVVFQYQKLLSNINAIKNRFKRNRAKPYQQEYTLDFTLLSTISKRKKIKLLQNNILYEFTYDDIFRLCIEKICYSEFMNVIPQYPKNPYTNVLFKKKDLYNIYIGAKLNRIDIPYLFKSFVFLYFNRELFYDYNDHVLNWKATIKYVNSLEDSTLIDFVYNIFIRHATHTLKLSVHDKYMIKIVEACKPAIYCDVYLTNFDPPNSIYNEKKKIIYKSTRKFIDMHPELVKKKRLMVRNSNISNYTSNLNVNGNTINYTFDSGEDTESYSDSEN